MFVEPSPNREGGLRCKHKVIKLLLFCLLFYRFRLDIRKIYVKVWKDVNTVCDYHTQDDNGCQRLHRCTVFLSQHFNRASFTTWIHVVCWGCFLFYILSRFSDYAKKKTQGNLIHDLEIPPQTAFQEPNDAHENHQNNFEIIFCCCCCLGTYVQISQHI